MNLDQYEETEREQKKENRKSEKIRRNKRENKRKNKKRIKERTENRIKERIQERASHLCQPFLGQAQRNVNLFFKHQRRRYCGLSFSSLDGIDQMERRV